MVTAKRRVPAHIHVFLLHRSDRMEIGFCEGLGNCVRFTCPNRLPGRSAQRPYGCAFLSLGGKCKCSFRKRLMAKVFESFFFLFFLNECEGWHLFLSLFPWNPHFTHLLQSPQICKEWQSFCGLTSVGNWCNKFVTWNTKFLLLFTHPPRLWKNVMGASWPWRVNKTHRCKDY